MVITSPLLELTDNKTDMIDDMTDKIAVMKVDEASGCILQSPVVKKVIDVVDEDGEEESKQYEESKQCEKSPRKRVHMKKTGCGVGGKRSSRSWRMKVRKVEDMNVSTSKDVAMKNAVMMLNEMFPPPSAPQYKVTSMTGTPNNPTFTMICTLLDQTFSGTGRSKK